jgi:hypothetical protein
MADIGTLNPEQMLQQQQILRQQRMAELLMNKPAPQGQMVGNRYVAPSFTQNLANLANLYVGKEGVEKAEQAQIDLAKAIRQGDIAATADFMQQKEGRAAIPAQVTEMAGPYGQAGDGANIPMPTATIAGQAAIPANPRAAYANLYADPRASARLQNMAFNKMTADPEAFTLGADQSRFVTNPDGTTREIAAGTRKPIQIDTGTHIEFRDANDISKVLQRIPKSQMPTAGQVYESAEGPLLINAKTGTASPLLINGQPIAPKAQPHIQNEITAINQQKSVINGVIKNVEANKDAFGARQGLVEGLPMGSVVQNRKMTPEQVQARANVFNASSAVVKERAGTAQSPSEKETIMKFLPSPLDSHGVIINKMIGFNKYLEDKERGTTAVSGAVKSYAPNTAAAATPKTSAAQATAPIYATNGKTRIMSTDGGNTWQPAGGQ